LPPAVVPWTRWLCRVRAGLPEQVTVTLPRVGAIVVHPARLAFSPPPEAAGEAFVFEVRGQRGRLVIDLALAAKLVTAVLGVPQPVALRSLGRAERGTLAAVVVAVLDAGGLAGATRVGLEPATAPSGDALTLELRVRGGAGEGLAWLDLPVAALPATLTTSPPALSLLNPLVALELARTTLTAGDLAAASPGDAVVFDGAVPLSARDSWPVDLRFGSCTLPAQLDTDGNLQRRAPLNHESEVPMSLPADDQKDTRPLLSEEVARALAGAPVEIVAELGRLTVRGDELAGLIEGGVLALGPRRPTQVQLRVGPRLWALGELVAIDDELAVRITELVR
jgi:flagellar motor switch/type III secretory pathway protein FliN